MEETLDTIALGIVGRYETGPVRATLPVPDPPIARSLGLDGGGLPIIHSEVPPEKLRALGHYQGTWAGRKGLTKHFADVARP